MEATSYRPASAARPRSQADPVCADPAGPGGDTGRGRDTASALRRFERSPIGGFLARHRWATWIFAGLIGAIAWRSIFTLRFFSSELVGAFELSAMEANLFAAVGALFGTLLVFPVGMVASRKLVVLSVAIPTPAAYVCAAWVLPENPVAGLICLLTGAFTTGAIPPLLWHHIQQLAGVGRRGRATVVSVTVWAIALWGLSYTESTIAGTFGYSALMLVVAALMTVMCVLVWLFVEPDVEGKRSPTIHVWLGVLQVLGEGKTLAVVGYAWLVQASYASGWANFFALNLGGGQAELAALMGGATIAAGGLLALAIGHWLWDRSPRAAVVLSLLLEAVAAGVATAVPGHRGMWAAGVIWETSSTLGTAGSGHLAQYAGDGRDDHRAIAAMVGRALGPILPLGVGAAIIDPDTTKLEPSQWFWANALWIPPLLLFGLVALGGMRRISRLIVARALRERVAHAATWTEKANLLVRPLGLRVAGELREPAFSWWASPVAVSLVSTRPGGGVAPTALPSAAVALRTTLNRRLLAVYGDSAHGRIPWSPAGAAGGWYSGTTRRSGPPGRTARRWLGVACS